MALLLARGLMAVAIAVAARVLAALVRSRAVLVQASILVLLVLSLGLSLVTPLVLAGLLHVLCLGHPFVEAWALGLVLFLRMSAVVRAVARLLALSLLRVV